MVGLLIWLVELFVVMLLFIGVLYVGIKVLLFFMWWLGEVFGDFVLDSFVMLCLIIVENDVVWWWVIICVVEVYE